MGSGGSRGRSPSKCSEWSKVNPDRTPGVDPGTDTRVTAWTNPVADSVEVNPGVGYMWKGAHKLELHFSFDLSSEQVCSFEENRPRCVCACVCVCVCVSWCVCVCVFVSV